MWRSTMFSWSLPISFSLSLLKQVLKIINAESQDRTAVQLKKLGAMVQSKHFRELRLNSHISVQSTDSLSDPTQPLVLHSMCEEMVHNFRSIWMWYSRPYLYLPMYCTDVHEYWTTQQLKGMQGIDWTDATTQTIIAVTTAPRFNLNQSPHADRSCIFRHTKYNAQRSNTNLCVAF